MVSRSLVRFGLVGIELACIPVVGKPLGVKVGVGKPRGPEVDLSSIARNFAAVSFRVWYLPPLDVCVGAGVSGVVVADGNMPFLWSRDQTWWIMAGMSDTVVVDPFNVSISSVSNRFVVVAVPGTKENKLSRGNHWSVS